ncbi:hypothetical protein JHK82_047661 [Glycine max]|nr:hypothetical protein JHK82_047661 [Glycine max]
MTKTVPSYVRVKAKGMIYTTIDMFYLTDEQLANSPSKKDGIDEATETTLRMYGCDLIQESGIFLRFLRTTLCVRFKSRFQVPIPENPPWWMAFDGENSGIDEVYAWFWVTFIAFQSHNIYQSARMGTLHFPTNHQKQSLNQHQI